MPSADFHRSSAATAGYKSVSRVGARVEGANATALDKTVLLFDTAIRSMRQRGGPRLVVVVAGDFDRHDQLWGGVEVLTSRQSDANAIIDFMDRWSLHSPLLYGTETLLPGK